METTVISLAMEGQFRFQVPAMFSFLRNNQMSWMGFLEVQVQLSRNMEDGVRDGWMKAYESLCASICYL